MAGNGNKDSGGFRLDTVGAIASIATLTGLLLYGVYFYSLSNFYQDLSISPDDVGLTQGALITRAAITSLFIIVTVLPPLTLAAWGLKSLIQKRLELSTQAEGQERRQWVICFSLSTVFLIIWLESLMVFTSLATRLVTILLLGVLCFWIGLWISKRILTNRSIALSPVIIILSIWLVYVIVMLPVLGLGEERGHKLWQTGETSLIEDFAGDAVLGWVRCVHLTWTGDKGQLPSTLPSKPVLRLGSKDGMLIVVDRTPEARPQLKYVPLGDVIVSEAEDQCRVEPAHPK